MDSELVSIAVKMASVFLVCLLLGAASCSVQLENVCISEKNDCSSTLNCQQCKPLQWLAGNTRNISNNSMVMFLPGNHFLSSTRFDQVLVNFSDMNNLTLRGMDETMIENNVVLCRGNTGFIFQYSVNICIQRITFNDCGATFTKAPALYFLHSMNITLSHIVIRNSSEHSVKIADSTQCGGFIEISDSKYSSVSSRKIGHNTSVSLQFEFSCPQKHLATTTIKLTNT